MGLRGEASPGAMAIGADQSTSDGSAIYGLKAEVRWAVPTAPCSRRVNLSRGYAPEALTMWPCAFLLGTASSGAK